LSFERIGARETMTFSLFCIMLGVFGAVFLGGCGIALWLDRYHGQLNARLRNLPGDTSLSVPGGKGAPSPAVQSIKRAPATSTGKTNRWISDRNEDRRQTQARMVQAGIYNPTALFSFFLMKWGLTIVPPLLGFLAGWLGVIDLRAGLMWGSAGGTLGMILPSLWLERRIKHRHCVFRQSLADFLDLMIVCLESGLSLQGTIQRVGDELQIAHPELAGELNIVQRDINFGATVDASLRRFAERSGYEGIRSLATFVREAQRFGTQLTEALRLHADMLRNQRELAAEETAQKAAVKILFPTLLLILPAVFVVLAGPAAIQIQQAFAK
jgi:tight adherence protein C